MTKLDFLLISLAIVAIIMILLLLQGVNNPNFFNILVQLGILENSSNGFKQIFLAVLYLAGFIFFTMLIVAFRFIKTILTPKNY